MTQAYARKRITDPQTSLFAADSVGSVSSVQQRILAILEDGVPRTDESIEVEYRRLHGHTATAQSLRSRRSELRDQGLVRFADELGRTRNGRSSRKWTVAS